MKPILRYIVMGEDRAKIAHLHILAQSEEEAIQKWREEFGERVRGWSAPTVEDLDALLLSGSYRTRAWMGNGFSYFSAG